MEISEQEWELMRRRMDAWRIAAPILEEIRTREIRSWTEEEARIVAERVMEAVPQRYDTSTTTSGLLEQQRWFLKASGR